MTCISSADPTDLRPATALVLNLFSFSHCRLLCRQTTPLSGSQHTSLCQSAMLRCLSSSTLFSQPRVLRFQLGDSLVRDHFHGGYQIERTQNVDQVKPLSELGNSRCTCFKLLQRQTSKSSLQLSVSVTEL